MFTEQQKLPKHLTQEELKRFFGAIKSKRDRALFALIYHYGFRVSEAVGLQLSDLDLHRGKIYVRRLKGSISGEKPLWRDTQKIVKAYLRERIPKGETLFTGRSGQLTTRRVSQLFKRYLGEAGLAPDKWGVHSLRHSIAVHILDAGQPLEFVKDHLGHVSIKNTEIYARISDPRRQEIFDRLERHPAVVRP